MNYAIFVGLAFVVGLWIRRIETRRLGYTSEPGHAWVALGALAGAIIGAKLGMFLFYPLDQAGEIFRNILSLDFTGKTIIGGLIGGFIGVEVTKKLVGINHSTGDAFAVALPVAQAIGRVGCWAHGCCYGVKLSSGGQIPVQFIEGGALLVVAAVLWRIRARPRPEGHLFRYYLIGYAFIRFSLEPLRGDPAMELGPFTAVQVVCLLGIVGFTWSVLRQRRALGKNGAQDSA
jgi:phosphatidylglycerol:prolipoprotein diacylglycerol transferase